jgi:hypothetical protein
MYSIKIDQIRSVRLQVLTAESMKITAFWDTAPYSLVEADRCFEVRIASIHEISYRKWKYVIPEYKSGPSLLPVGQL